MFLLRNGQTGLVCQRREFLRVAGGLAAASFVLPAALAPRLIRAGNTRPSAQAKSCILVYLLGGPPHQDMWDLKPDAPDEIRGPFRPAATSVPGLQICEHLPQLATIAHKYALVRSLSHANSNHTPMIYYTLTGRDVERPNEDNDVRPPQRGDFPHMGATVARFKPSASGLPAYVAMPEVAVRTNGDNQRGWTLLRGGGSGFLGPQFEPLGVNGEPGTPAAIPALRLPDEVTAERFEQRRALHALLDGRGPRAGGAAELEFIQRRALLLTGAASRDALQAFSVDGEPEHVQERYGRHRFGRALLTARRLVEAGVPMVAVHFNDMSRCDGWDTHANNFEALQSELLPLLDQGLSALIDDMHERGSLAETVIACLGEFGRTPKINANAGRDHWGDCGGALLAGGGIRPGMVLGASDKHAAYPTQDPVDPVDIQATLYHLLGLPRDATITDLTGRPWPLTAGKVIEQLI
jgi:hypothetical protein